MFGQLGDAGVDVRKGVDHDVGADEQERSVDMSRVAVNAGRDSVRVLFATVVYRIIGAPLWASSFLIDRMDARTSRK